MNHQQQDLVHSIFHIHNIFSAYINSIVNLIRNHLIATCILHCRSREKLYDEEEDVYWRFYISSLNIHYTKILFTTLCVVFIVVIFSDIFVKYFKLHSNVVTIYRLNFGHYSMIFAELLD